MDNVIKEIYRNLIQDKKIMDGISQEIQIEINKVMEKERMQMDWQEYEEYRDKIFLISSVAEEGGFVKGFKYAIVMMLECMNMN